MKYINLFLFHQHFAYHSLLACGCLLYANVDGFVNFQFNRWSWYINIEQQVLFTIQEHLKVLSLILAWSVRLSWEHVSPIHLFSQALYIFSYFAQGLYSHYKPETIVKLS